MPYGETSVVLPESPALVHTRAVLCRIHEEPDLSEQFKLTAFPYSLFGNERPTLESIDALIDFAADPSSSPSLLVRAKILDEAINNVSLGKRSDPGIAQRADELKALIPDSSNMKLVAMTSSPYWGYADEGHLWLRGMAEALACKEGIDTRLVFPDWYALGYTNDYPDCNPYGAFMLLKQISEASRNGDPLPLNKFSRLLPLALAVQEALPERTDPIDLPNAKQLHQQARIARLIAHGDDHQPQLESIVHASSPERLEYVEALNDLYDAAANLRTVFPAEVADQVATGAQELAASAAFAINEHITQGFRTDVRLPVGNRTSALALRLSGDEPLALLRRLRESMTTLQEVTNDPDSVTTTVTTARDYDLYRVLSVKTSKQASVYIRPRGGYNYDPAIEYGRPTEGVEASISYVVDSTLPSGALLEVGRHRRTGSDNRISIRLDREGIEPARRGEAGIVRDPAQEHGTLSLDVGSIIGDDEWLSTKIGRLLAWGDQLKRQQRGEQTHLNHVTDYFTVEQGHTAVFAALADRVKQQMEQRRVGVRVLAALGLGVSIRHTD